MRRSISLGKRVQLSSAPPSKDRCGGLVLSAARMIRPRAGVARDWSGVSRGEEAKASHLIKDVACSELDVPTNVDDPDRQTGATLDVQIRTRFVIISRRHFETAEAQPRNPEQMERLNKRAACRADVRRLCRSVPPDEGSMALYACLKANRDKLSVRCGQVIASDRR